MEEVKRAAGYIRVSTAEQSLKGLSIETQIAEIKAYAKLHSMKLEEVYVDRGITARKSLEKRVDFMRMMRDVESGRINHIIVLRLDRFFRNVYDYHKMMNEYLEPNKCDWSAVKEQYTTATTNGRLMINLRLSIAEQECDTDSDRIKDVLDHRAKQGFAITGAQPYGLKIIDHRVVRDEETSHIVKELFNTMEILSSVRKTMFAINDKYGTTFDYRTVKKMMKNPLYCGLYRGREYCEPTVTKEQFDRVQRLLSMNVKVRKNKYTYIFSGLVVCDHCNRRMSGKYSTRRGVIYFSYKCNKAVLDHSCTNNLTISTKRIEKYLFENIEELMEEHMMSLEVKSKEKKSQKSNRKAIEKKLERLSDLYVDGFIDKEKYRADYTDLQSQIIDDAPEEPKKDLTEMKKFLQSDFKNKYKTLSDEQKQSLWRRIIKEIRVSGKDVTGIKFL